MPPLLLHSLSNAPKLFSGRIPNGMQKCITVLPFYRKIFPNGNKDTQNLTTMLFEGDRRIVIYNFILINNYIFAEKH
jgi:hypothetical protein